MTKDENFLPLIGEKVLKNTSTMSEHNKKSYAFIYSSFNQ